MELNQLRAFLAVAEEMHFGRAAKRLHMAQPPLSRSIQRLERELGAQLFERSTRRVLLTTAGEALIDPAREVLEALERVRMVAQAAGEGVIGRVRLGYAGMSSLGIVSRLARAVRQEHPGMQLELVSHQYARDVMELLTSRAIDLAIGRWDEWPSDVDSRVLAIEDLVVAVPAGHALAGRSVVTMADCDGENFVSLPASTGTLPLQRLSDMARRAGAHINVVQTAPDSWTLMSLVAAQVGCSITVSSVVGTIADPHVCFIPLDDPLARVELRVAWRRESYNGAIRAVVGLLDEVVRDPTALGSRTVPVAGGQSLS